MTKFEEEIRSQGAILRARALAGASEARRAAEGFRGITHLVVAARGSSDNAAIFLQYLAGQELGLLVALAAPSLYEGAHRMNLSGAGVLAISQSGRSPGMVEVLTQANQQGCTTVALTNYLTSSLAESSDVVLELRAGPEEAVASTKTFSATWHSLAQLVDAMSTNNLEGIEDLPEVVERVAAWALNIELPLDLLDVAGLTMVGRGVGYAVASEVALKVREVSGVRAESYAAPDYLHGPVGADGAGCTLVAVITDELEDAVLFELLQGCRGSQMATVVIRSPRRAAVDCDAEIVLPEVGPNWVEALCAVILGQVIALRLGEIRGRDIDTSPGLSKVTLSA
ncbi:MAG: SIS domain-containing protein [Acidimicrobiaceae bacterium]|nr:SIS domain-containing protein [Acidimicrobiaceae bacterium]